MKTKMRKLAGRIVLIATLCLLAMTLLAGCGGGKTKSVLTLKQTLPPVTPTTEEFTGNNLTGDQLLKIATMMTKVYTAEFDPREMLVAAMRGYDMTAEGFSDEGDFPVLEYTPENDEKRLTAAKNVLRAANEKAKAEDQIGNEFESMNLVDVQYLVNAFKTTVDLTNDGGFFDTILSGIGVALQWMTNTLTFKSYLAGICLFAVIIEILMLPFAIKQQRNSIRQARLRPKEMAIRNKYKGRTDQVTMQKMNQEIQEFYQRENFSPYSGCLPLLIQLPIIIALYNIVIDPLHYVMGQASTVSAALDTYYSAARAAGGLGGALGGNGTIAVLSDIKLNGIGLLDGLKNFAYFENGTDIYNSLAAVEGKIPNFNIGSVNFGLTPSLNVMNILLLVPVLTFAAYFLTSKLNRKFMYQPTANAGADARQVACSNTIMDITMPLMSTVFTFMVPALVGIYWIFRSLVGLLKQFIISRAMPMPVFTEEDYKQAAREMAGKRIVKKSENVGKVRSLHHIDDEDFEDTRERALARKAAIAERERAEQAERQQNASFAEAPMKEDRKKNRKDKKSPAAETDEAPTEAQETEASDDSQNTNQE